jgi:hypothetical protein
MIRKEIKDKGRHESAKAVTTIKKKVLHDNEEVGTSKSKLVRQCQYDCSYGSFTSHVVVSAFSRFFSTMW